MNYASATNHDAALLVLVFIVLAICIIGILSLLLRNWMLICGIFEDTPQEETDPRLYRHLEQAASIEQQPTKEKGPTT